MATVSDEEIEAMKARFEREPALINSLEFGRWIATHKTAVMDWAGRKERARAEARRAQEQADGSAP